MISKENSSPEQLPLFSDSSPRPEASYSPLVISPKHIGIGRTGLARTRASLTNPDTLTFAQGVLPLSEPAVADSPLISKELAQKALTDARQALEIRREESAEVEPVELDRSRSTALIEAARRRTKQELTEPFVQPTAERPTHGVADPEQLAWGMRLLAEFWTSERFTDDRVVLRNSHTSRD